MGFHLVYKTDGAIAVLYCKKIIMCLCVLIPHHFPNGIHPCGRPHLYKSVMTIVLYSCCHFLFL